jgi:hypothetical protein
MFTERHQLQKFVPKNIYNSTTIGRIVIKIRPLSLPCELTPAPLCSPRLTPRGRCRPHPRARYRPKTRLTIRPTLTVDRLV